MTDEERRLLFSMADYVERKLESEIGRVAGAKDRLAEFKEARLEAEGWTIYGPRT
jgi:hypothetical protein